LNCKSFEVQQSVDGNDFATVAIIRAKGSTTGSSDYTFTHVNPLDGMNYYRLKEMDIDGNYHYSEIVTAKINSKNTILLYPNPVTEKLIIESSLNTTILVTNHVGQLLRMIHITKGRNEISVLKFPPGVYFLTADNHEVGKFNVIR